MNFNVTRERLGLLGLAFFYLITNPMDDENELIYIALCNNLIAYSNLLEDEELNENDIELANYIISRTNAILDKYELMLNGETPIKRPSWTTGQ